MHQATHHLHPTSYITLFNNMSNFMKKPNIIIHLDVTPEESLRRIKMRSRDCESSVSLEYLVELRAAYDDFIKQISLVIPVIKVNWSEFRSTDVNKPYKHAHTPTLPNLTLSPSPPLLRKWQHASRKSMPSCTTFAL